MSEAANPVSPGSKDSEKTAVRRIELIWPGKDTSKVPRQLPEGDWVLEDPPASIRLHPFVDFRGYAEPGEDASVVIAGDKQLALDTLSRALPQEVRLAYLDTPRIEVDDKTSAFRGDPTFIYSTWLTVLRDQILRIEPLLRRDGFLVIHTGDIEEPYARLIADEIFSRENRVATIIWQRAYAPRNMKGMKEFTATHDCLLVYAVNKAALSAVGLRGVPSGFSNPDDDPRGAWKAEHKGAHSRRPKSDFNTYGSPYRWRITEGALPDGLWRLNPITGAIWGIPRIEGKFPLEIEVQDAKGATARRRFSLHCSDCDRQNNSTSPPIPWLFEPFRTKGPLSIATAELPSGRVGYEYSAVFLAKGGTPYTPEPKRPGSGRYWEFADDTLLDAYRRDAVHLGKDGNAIPHPKAYVLKAGDSVVTNQVTWWPGRDNKGAKAFAGYTEDATKHLKKLAEVGLIGATVNTAKPEYLLARLIDIFTDPRDIVLEVFGEAADLSAVALKRQRRFVFLAGGSIRQSELLDKCSLPRLRAVIEGKDKDLEKHEGEIRMRDDAYIPYEGGGSLVVCKVGEWLFERRRDEEFPRLNRDYLPNPDISNAILTSQGFMPFIKEPDVNGISLTGTAAAVVIPPDSYLDNDTAAQVASNVGDKFKRVVILYFRAADDFKEEILSDRIVCRRIPTGDRALMASRIRQYRLDEARDRVLRSARLRPPQRQVFDRVHELISMLRDDVPRMEQREVVEYLKQRGFDVPASPPQLIAALATGVGKTRLMGSLLTYLCNAGQTRNCLILAPRSTILEKLERESQIGNPKYLFIDPALVPHPNLCFRYNVESFRPSEDQLNVFILSPQSITGRDRRFSRDSEFRGFSVFDYLASVRDLIIFVDEAHHIGNRGGEESAAWMEAITALQPRLYFGFTATPRTDPGVNILYSYDLARCLQEGLYTKAVDVLVEKRDEALTDDDWDHYTIDFALRRLERKRLAINEYRNSIGTFPAVEPVLLICARDTDHAEQIGDWLRERRGITEEELLITHSEREKTEEDIKRLVGIDQPGSKVKIVVNVFQLTEGWDVTNVYVIAPLRAMATFRNAVQTMGRGLRLPAGYRTGNHDIDVLDVLCCGRETFEEILLQATEQFGDQGHGIPIGVKQGLGLDPPVVPMKETVITAVRAVHIPVPTCKHIYAEPNLEFDITKIGRLTQGGATALHLETLERTGLDEGVIYTVDDFVTSVHARVLADLRYLSEPLHGAALDALIRRFLESLGAKPEEPVLADPVRVALVVEEEIDTRYRKQPIRYELTRLQPLQPGDYRFRVPETLDGPVERVPVREWE